MAKSLKLSDLKQGLIIKVEFGNGDVLKGCFYGKNRVFYYRSNVYNEEVKVEKGNFMVTLNPVERKPVLININEYKDSKKTSFKQISGTRFPKEVSDYLRKYVKAYANQQKQLIEEVRLREKRLKEEQNLYKISGEGESLNYEVDAEELPVVDKIKLLVNKLNKDKGLVYTRNISYIQVDVVKYSVGRAGLEIYSRIESLDNLDDTEIGVYPFHEYDGSYQPDIDVNFDLLKTVVSKTSLSRGIVADFIRDLGSIKGVKLVEDDVFDVSTGDYSGDGSIQFSIRLDFDNSVKFEDMKKAGDLVLDFIKKI